MREHRGLKRANHLVLTVVACCLVFSTSDGAPEQGKPVAKITPAFQQWEAEYARYGTEKQRVRTILTAIDRHVIQSMFDSTGHVISRKTDLVPVLGLRRAPQQPTDGTEDMLGDLKSPAGTGQFPSAWYISMSFSDDGMLLSYYITRRSDQQVHERRDEELTADTVARWRQTYDDCKTRAERREVCIELIDAGVLRRGERIRVVDRIFGTDLERTAAEGERIGGLHLAEQTAGLPTRGHEPRGWDLVMTFDGGTVLRDFYLTNVHKGFRTPTTAPTREANGS